MSEFYDAAVVKRADARVREIVDAMLGLRGRGAVVVEAPAGAGKSYSIGTAVLASRARELRVAVATPTNDQAFSMVEHLAGRVSEDVVFVPASDVALPDDVANLANVRSARARDTAGADLIVGTLSKLGNAFSRGDLAPFDVLLIDEAFQANAVQYYAAGGIADRQVLMGDRGQLAPFTTAPEGNRWRGLDEDPLLTAAEVLRRNHGKETRVVQLPVTRRLDPRGARIARAFYPGHPFDAAVLPGVRRLALGAGGRRAADLDAVLNRAGVEGWAHSELPGAALTIADPATIELIVRLVARMFERSPTVCCERIRTPRPLARTSVAVAVSHNDQKNLLRVTLDEAGLREVVVNTANKLQGLTFDVVVAWHPLAGQIELDEFHLDPGRLCVMLTRHRHACIVIGRASDRELVKEIPPSSPAYVGWDQNPTLDGWYAHEAVFEALAPFRISAT